MNRENRILILTGLAMIALTMFFGFWYAVFDEHQTLVGMIVAMMNGFLEAARGNLPEAYGAIDEYGRIAKEYRREVHFHGHWGFLGLILILYGLVAHTIHFSQRARVLLATCLAASAILFPFGVLLQIGPMDWLGKIFAVLGSIGLVFSMLAFVTGILRRREVSG